MFRRVVIALVLAVGLGACSVSTTVQNVKTGIQIATTGVQNPVSKQDLYNFENSLIVVFAALKAYRNACEAGAVDVNCKANIRAIQAYTKQIPPLLARVRTFVKNNDQVNAVLLFNEAKAIYDQMKAFAISKGVAVQ